MTVLVVDASVAIKWFTPEIYTPAAERLLASPAEFAAPDLLFAEIASILRKKVLRGELRDEKAVQAFEKLQQIDVKTVPCRELAEEAYGLAVRTGASAYDSMYLALAVRLETRLITADLRLFNTIRPLPRLAEYISFIADS